MPLAEGERLGPFLLLERIGRGGMGEVWLAQPVSIPGVAELCVVKTVRAEQADDPDALKRFADETRLAMLLNHPHISRVVDAGRAGDVRYLAMALVEGLDLLNLLKRLAERGRALDDHVALWIGACLLDALAFAHEAQHPLTRAPLGVVHRDISPQNVMCARTGDAHVIDFGLALSSVKQAKTEQDVVLGKLSYMAPEQARADKVDRRTDIYAAGVVIYELLVGRRYWGDLDHNGIWMRAGKEDWSPPHWSTLAPDLQAFLAPLLARDVQRRANDARVCLEALLPLLVSRGGAALAAQDLAAIVQELAVPELERAARARAAMVTTSLPPEDDAPTENNVVAAASLAPLTLAPQTVAPNTIGPRTVVHELPPDTQSLAIDDAALVAAAMATKTVALPIVAFVPPGLSRIGLPRPATTTVLDARAATLPASAALASPPRRPSRAPVAIGAALALALVAGVAALAIPSRHDAAATASDAGTRAATAAGMRVDAGAAPAVAFVVDAGAAGVGSGDAHVDVAATDAGAASAKAERPPRRTLDHRLAALKGCKAACVPLLQRLAPLEQRPSREQAAKLLDACERTCRKSR